MNRRTAVRLTLATVFVASTLLYSWACGSSMNPAGPTSGGGGPTPTTISIIGQLGSQSYSPNPATVAAGQAVVFKNLDSTTHHIVQDGSGFDTGNLAPGATSAPVTITSSTTITYHCSIHPTMVGGINGSGSSTPGGPGY